MTPNTEKHTSPKTIRWMWIVVFAPIGLLLFLLLLSLLGLFGRLPSFEELENPKSNLATEIYSEDGQVIGTYYVQNRSYMQYEELFPEDSTLHISLDEHEVPPVVAALISTEDARFRNHAGIDIPSLVRVGVKTIALHNSSQGGGSTITQQLAKNLFPRDTVRNRAAITRKGMLVLSKLKEWITALKLEYNYTKEEIATMYLNTVEFGSNAYGIKSAAHTFFNKEPRELNLQEAAMLVGVVNAPTRYSPVRNPENALERRNLVLARMKEAGAITRHQRDSLCALPITLNFKPVSHNEGSATYFREMLRLVMSAEKPTRRQFVTDWDYEQALKEYNENPIYGWCLKNTKADGTPYNIYRSGFWNLTLIACLNLGLIFLCDLFVKKCKTRTVLTLVLALMTLPFIGLSLLKMGLYIGKFALTPMRVYVALFLCALLLFFVFVIFNRFIPAVKLFPLGVAVLAALMLVIGYGGIDRTVAKYNIELAITRGTELDFHTLDALSDGAVPEFLSIPESITHTDYTTADAPTTRPMREALLRSRERQLRVSAERGCQNLETARAAKLCSK
ncbi:MAG: transglycosylase domain-containing protein [Alistipes sp.]